MSMRGRRAPAAKAGGRGSQLRVFLSKFAPEARMPIQLQTSGQFTMASSQHRNALHLDARIPIIRALIAVHGVLSTASSRPKVRRLYDSAYGHRLQCARNLYGISRSSIYHAAGS